jgi:6-phosphogluconolactonase/glucosamine-6-phosphate isomerase/deaminase
VLQTWNGPVFVLQASNDSTQNESDLPRYKRLFGRDVSLIDMGAMGHTALLFDPEAFVELLEGAFV